jgi:type II secretory pathway pseudopilin PulG
MAPRSTVRSRQGGFTYLGLIVLVTVIGMVGAATLKIDSLLRRAAAEEELLSIGAEFSAALASYAAATPQGQLQQPPTLQELLKDPRSPALRRHLRKIFIDPVTGTAEWGIVYVGDRAGILGVYSLSQARPLKIGNFDARFPGFDNKQHLSDWKFTAALMPVAPVAPPPAGSAAPAAPLFPPQAQQQPQQQPIAPAPPEPAPEPAAAEPPPTAEPVEPKVEEKAEEKTEDKPEVVTPPPPTERR